MFEHNQRKIGLGNKLNDVAERFFQNNKKRPLIADLLRLVESENAKRKRKTPAQVKKNREVKKEVAKEAYEYMNNIVDQFRNLIKYFNEQMIMIGITYNQVVPQIQERKENFPRVLEREFRGVTDITNIKYSNFYQNTRKFNTKDYKNVKTDQ